MGLPLASVYRRIASEPATSGQIAAVHIGWVTLSSYVRELASMDGRHG